MEPIQKFKAIYSFIKENGVDQNTHKGSIGGMWTVWTHNLSNFGLADYRCQLMDEGYSKQIITPNLVVWVGYDNKLDYRKGNENDLDKCYQEILKLNEGK